MIAYQQELSMSDTYDWLVSASERNGHDLTASAADVLRRAHQRDPG